MLAGQDVFDPVRAMRRRFDVAVPGEARQPPGVDVIEQPFVGVARIVYFPSYKGWIRNITRTDY
jgi:hypothetical protein